MLNVVTTSAVATTVVMMFTPERKGLRKIARVTRRQRKDNFPQMKGTFSIQTRPPFSGGGGRIASAG